MNVSLPPPALPLYALSVHGLYKKFKTEGVTEKELLKELLKAVTSVLFNKYS